MRRLWTALKHHVDSLYDSARVSGDPRWNTVVTELFRTTHKIWSDIALATRSSRAHEADEIGHDGAGGVGSKEALVRAAGLEPAQFLRTEGFSYHFGFRRRARRARASGPFVVWTIPSP